MSYATSMANLREAIKRIRVVAKMLRMEEKEAKEKGEDPLNRLDEEE
jgi:hypothetical protein